MIRLIYLFYVVVALVSAYYLVTAWVENPQTKLPYREPIHRRW
jgi:hypothetical protein